MSPIPELTRGESLIDACHQALIKVCRPGNTKAQRVQHAKSRKALVNYMKKLERECGRSQPVKTDRITYSGKGFTVRRLPSGRYSVQGVNQVIGNGKHIGTVDTPEEAQALGLAMMKQRGANAA